MWGVSGILKILAPQSPASHRTWCYPQLGWLMWGKVFRWYCLLLDCLMHVAGDTLETHWRKCLKHHPLVQLPEVSWKTVAIPAAWHSVRVFGASFCVNVLGRGMVHTFLGGGKRVWDYYTFFPWYNYLNEFSFADTDMNNSGAALQIKTPSPGSNSALAETCLVGCLN